MRRHCPFCNTSTAAFLENGQDLPILRLLRVVGAGKRRTRCAQCRSKDRERLLYLFLKEQTDLFTKEQCRLLHIAPEKNIGRVLSEQKNIDYVSGDKTKGKAALELDIEDLPFEDESFDVVLCNHVLEHVTNDEKALSELHRVMKMDGWAILQVPYAENLQHTISDDTLTTPEERATYFGQHDHRRIYALPDYQDRLRAAGFDVDLSSFARTLPPSTREQYALNPEEIIIRCRRQGR